MKALIGLGNPGKDYLHTRHNAGFLAVARFAERYEVPLNKTRYNSIFAKTKFDGEDIILLFPLTFMNLSGNAVKQLIVKEGINLEDLLIISDDIHIELGTLRLRESGSAGGHNGLKSVIATIGSDDFSRLRIGVGPKPEKMDLSDFVLENFKKSELKILDSVLDVSTDAISLWIKEGIKESMAKYNGHKIEI